MNAHAHLLSLGWAGPGHSLDSRPNSPGIYKQKGHRGLAYDPAKDPLRVGNTGNGLVKPLLVSQRKNRFGIGRKAHEAPAGNEWWLKGFESALGNIGKSESERSSGTNTPSNGFTAGKHVGLYSFFIQGQVMQGTIGQAMQKSSRKRKSEEYEAGDNPQLNPRPTSPKKPATPQDFEMVGAFMRERDRNEKKRSKRKKASETEQFAQIGQFFTVVDKSRKKRKSETLDKHGNEAPLVQDPEERAETKAERRERRRRKKEEKTRRAAANSNPQESTSEDSAARAARRAEKKRRKAENPSNDTSATG